MPRSSAWRMAAMDASSSCGPQPKAHSPPMAQAPKPTLVMASPLRPSGRVGSEPAALERLADADVISFPFRFGSARELSAPRIDANARLGPGGSHPDGRVLAQHADAAFAECDLDFSGPASCPARRRAR